MAARHNSSDIAELLIRSGADVNARASRSDAVDHFARSRADAYRVSTTHIRIPDIISSLYCDHLPVL